MAKPRRRTRKAREKDNAAHQAQIAQHATRTGAIPDDEIRRVVLAIDAEGFAGVKPFARLKPDGSPTLLRLADYGRLSERELDAWRRYIDDVEQAAGKSGNVTMSWTEKIDGGGAIREPVSVYANTPFQRLERLYGEGEWQGRGFLHRHEQRILYTLTTEWLEVQRRRRRDGIHAEHFGVVIGGFKDKAQARANGAAWIAGTLKTLASFYGTG